MGLLCLAQNSNTEFTSPNEEMTLCGIHGLGYTSGYMSSSQADETSRHDIQPKV